MSSPSKSSFSDTFGRMIGAPCGTSEVLTRMKMVGNVEVPQSAFMAVLKSRNADD